MTAAEGRENAPERLAHRLPAIAALGAIAVLYLLISDRLTLGPPWLPLVAIAALVGVVVFERVRPRPGLVRGVALAVTAVITLTLVASTVLLVSLLLGRGLPGLPLLEGAAGIWVVNVLTFAIWYFEIDGGGPLARHRTGPRATDFLFPQYTLSSNATAGRSGPRPWAPSFVDYLFLSFNTSAAFSPTDTLVLSGRAKLLMMLQSLMSLMTIAVLAARAINTLA